MEAKPVNIIINLGPKPEDLQVKIAVLGTPLSIEATEALYETIGAALNRADELDEVLA